MDRLSLWTGSGQCKLIGSHSGLLKMTVMYRWPLWTSGRYGRFYCITHYSLETEVQTPFSTCPDLGRIILNHRGRVVRAWDTLIMLTLRRAEGREFDPRPGQCSRMSFSSDQVTGTVFPHLNMPFLPNSKFI